MPNEEERKVYELVVRHFLACCSKDATGEGHSHYNIHTTTFTHYNTLNNRHNNRVVRDYSQISDSPSH